VSDLKSELLELDTAEDFLDFFAIPYAQSVIDVCRLHILQRAHDYMASDDSADLDDGILHARFKSVLERAYQDFVESTPMSERVFKVLREAKAPAMNGQSNFVPLEAILGPGARKTP
jgi:nitrogenase-stabilizing/protective protein